MTLSGVQGHVTYCKPFRDVLLLSQSQSRKAISWTITKTTSN